MKKNIPKILIALLALPFWALGQQQKEVDPIAVNLLDRMASIIGHLESCSYRLSISYDEKDLDYGMLRHSAVAEVHLVGPGKAMVNMQGDEVHKGYWYNGDTVTFYSYTENNYAVVDAPDEDIVGAIDFAHNEYGADFPGADLLYPTLTDDILTNFDSLHFIGKAIIEGESTLHLKAANASTEIQLWISNDGYNLPKKFLITKKGAEYQQYRAIYTFWDINPTLPDGIFEFTPPPGAREIAILPKSQS